MRTQTAVCVFLHNEKEAREDLFRNRLEIKSYYLSREHQRSYALLTA